MMVSIQDLLNELSAAVRPAPFTMCWHKPKSDCRRPAPLRCPDHGYFLTEEGPATEIGVLIQEKDGHISWVGDMTGEECGDEENSAGHKVMVVMYCKDSADEGKSYDSEFDEEAGTAHSCRVEEGIIPAWMSSGGFTTPENERAAVHSWICGFNCGREVGTAAAGNSMTRLAGQIARGEVK